VLDAGGANGKFRQPPSSARLPGWVEKASNDPMPAPIAARPHPTSTERVPMAPARLLFAEELPGGCRRQQVPGQDLVRQRIETAILSGADALAEEIGGGAGNQIARPTAPALLVVDLQSRRRRGDGFDEGGNALPGGGGGL
jgi:hypothetical protein